MQFNSRSQRMFLKKNVKNLLNLKTISKEKLFINTFSEKNPFSKEFDIVKIKLNNIFASSGAVLKKAFK